MAVILGGIMGVGVAAVINMPRVESLSDFTPGQITQLFDRHGKVFATYAREKRVLLREGDVPELLQQAILAAEDRNFFQHGGVDAEGVLRAALKNLSRKRTSRIGGSTITMQLARELYLTRKKTWQRKIEEALLSVELEKNFSKQQILTLYCNLIFLGHGNYGFEAAAQSYFNKSVADLTLPEAAMLAGIPQRPSAYSAYHRPDLVIERRDYVLRRMQEEGFITQEEYQIATDEPLLVVPQRQEDLLAPYFAEEVRRYLETTYGSQGLLERGLQVETTLDPDIQRAAEKALRQGLLSLDHRKGWRGAPFRIEDEDLENFELPSWSNLELQAGDWVEGLVIEVDRRSARVRVADREFEVGPADMEWVGNKSLTEVFESGDVAWFEAQSSEEGGDIDLLLLEQEPKLEGAVVVLESATGELRAMVGGWDFSRSSFNRATQARRQVGSAFKAFVYGTALETGFTPADTLFDAPAVFPGANLQLTYSPRNNSRRYYGITTLRRGLEHSMNVTSTKLGDLVGMDRVVDFARRCGISSPLSPYPSLALGTAELIPVELTAAYAAIANQGVFVEPFLIDRIAGPDGGLVEEHQPQAHQAMEPEIASVLGHMLAGVVTRGTAISMRALDVDLAGKTGTTDRYVDAWFVGFSPKWTILSWVGHDQNEPIGRRMTGAAAALPIWRSIVETGLEEGWVLAGGEFSTPPSVVQMPVEYFTGLLPGPGASAIVQEAFIAGTEPTRLYDPEWQRIMRLPWYQQRPFYLAKAGERMPDNVEDWTLIQEIWAED
jgi:penicillin-binding protein 1A